MKTKQLILCALFTALIAVGAFLRIPTGLIPITFQVLFVIFTGLMLPPKAAFIPPLVYISLGLAGIPIFAHGGGISYVLQPSFGYLIGFAVLALMVSLLVRPNLMRLISKSGASKPLLIVKIALYALLSLCALYIIGITYMYLILKFYLGSEATYGYLLGTYTSFYILFDSIKFAIAVPLSAAVLRRMPSSMVD